MKKLIDVYPYQLKEKKVQFLVLQRAEKVIYEGQWRMVGGKVKEGEARWEAGLRELDEETGLYPSCYWSLPSVNPFYEPETDEMHLIPAFGAEIAPASEVLLDREHSGFKWIDLSKIDRYIKWPEQRRLMRLIHQIVTDEEILDDWIISIGD